MPQRPSKKPKGSANTKANIVKGLASGDKAAQQRHEEKAARTIIGRFQGRKSTERN
jgi:hypothetical protein